MLVDALVSFIPPGAPLSLVGGAGVAIPSPVIDLLGLGQGIDPATADIIGNATLWGTDLGIGELKLQTEVLITTALTANVGTPTLNVAFQGAPDAGTPTFLPGAWTTLVETGPIALANLGLGKAIARFDFPPAVPVNFRPRFIRLLFSPAAGTSFAAGTVLAPVTTVRDDWAIAFQPRNYAVKRPTGT